jgi:hypothetical protein
MAPLVVATLVGCSQEYDLVTVAPDGVVAPDGGAAPVRADHGIRGSSSLPVRAPDLATTDRPVRPRKPRHPRPDLEAQEVPLGGGAASDVVDFLFVVDGSTSMKRVVEQVYDGFDALVAEDAFPADGRVAVTSTLPAEEVDGRIGRRAHPGVHGGKIVRLDPGFQRLVDGAGILAYREAYPELREQFALDGCDAWTAAGARNAAGVPCFEAHTQLSMLPVGVEAGLTAVDQLLRRQVVFRTGAAANIVFVSDTQDPGLGPDKPGFEELVALRPSGPEVVAHAADRQLTASLRVHSIAPVTSCGSEQYDHIGDVYGDAARATGGRSLDVCTATPDQYVAMIRGIVAEGSVPTEPVVPLSRTDRVRAVFVDGQEVPYHLSRDKKAVILDSGMPSSRSKVRVEFKVPTEARGSVVVAPGTTLAP